MGNKIYAQLDDAGKVFTVSSGANTMIEISEADNRLIGAFYDETTKTFVGHKIILTADKTTITADGTDTATITATVYNWDGTVATDYANAITCSANGQSLDPETPVNGAVTFPLTSQEPGTTYTITASVDDSYLMSVQSVEVAAQ